ncbi:MAG: hypothetical protein ACUVV6_04185 [Thermoplasmatota archaeon]
MEGGEGGGALPSAEMVRRVLERRFGPLDGLELARGAGGAVARFVAGGRGRALELRPYRERLARVAEEGELTGEDEALARGLGTELVLIHSERRRDPELYRRGLRRSFENILSGLDALVSGELMFPDEASELAVMAARWWGRLRLRPERLSRAWGGRIPDELWAAGGELVLGRAAEGWGDPAQELASGALLFLTGAIVETGGFAGPFRELFLAFFGRYIEETGEGAQGALEALPFHISGAALRSANDFIPKGDAGGVGRTFVELARNSLEQEEFRVEDLSDLLE